MTIYPPWLNEVFQECPNLTRLYGLATCPPVDPGHQRRIADSLADLQTAVASTTSTPKRKLLAVAIKEMDKNLVSGDSETTVMVEAAGRMAQTLLGETSRSLARIFGLYQTFCLVCWATAMNKVLSGVTG